METTQSIARSTTAELEAVRRLCERELEIIRGDNSLESAGKRMAYAKVMATILGMKWAK